MDISAAQTPLGTLEVQETELRELSAEVSRTLAVGDKVSTSLNTTLSICPTGGFNGSSA